MRILYIPDSHTTLRNPNNRIDLVGESIEMWNKIGTEVIEQEGITAVIQGGDLFDRGEKKLPTQRWSDLMNAFDNLSSKVKGNTFIVMGNHEYTYSKDNPTFLITEMMSKDLLELYKHKDKLEMIKPIWKAPAFLDFGDFIIHFLHFHPLNKNYKVTEYKNKKVIGLYHDDLVSFHSKEELYHHRIGKGISITDTDLFENVDVAICGHIHTPLKDIILDNDRQTKFIVPGSMINRTSAEIHEYVDLPIISYENDNIKIDKYRYNLPPRSESFDIEKIEDNKSIYQFTKLMKETRGVLNSTDILTDILAKMNNPELEVLIRSSDEPLQLEGLKELTKFLEEDING